ncbi:MAG: ribosome silencing factor, partial [Rhodocyclales bacterium]|nr:ribosome silencing factor [Rhodocyclales bacterium]
MSKELSIKKLETIAVDALEDIKGRDIIIVNTTKVSQMFERIVLASGESNRQVRALARSVADKVREAGGEVLSTEGEETGEWVLVDLGPVVVHIMQPTVRAHFDLEGLWGKGKPANAVSIRFRVGRSRVRAVTPLVAIWITSPMTAIADVAGKGGFRKARTVTSEYAYKDGTRKHRVTS